MFKKSLNSLLYNKSMVIAIAICYALSIASIMYAYGFQKSLLQFTMQYYAIMQPMTPLNLDKAKEIGAKLAEDGFDYCAIFFIGDSDAVFYNNRSDAKSKPFSSGNEIITADATRRIGDKVKITNIEYTVIGHSPGFYNAYNIDNYEGNKTISKIVYKEPTVPTEKMNNQFMASISTYSENFKLAFSEEIKIVKAVTRGGFFIISLMLTALTLITALIMSTYLLYLRKKFMGVCLLCGVTRKRLLFTMLAEQLLLFIPMLDCGLVLYTIARLITKNTVAVLSSIDVAVIGFSYLTLMLSLTAVNITVIARSKNV